VSIEAELREEYDRRERRETTVFAVLPYVLLAVPTVVTVPSLGSLEHAPAVFALTVVAALWMAWSRTLRPTPARRRDRALRVVFYAGLTLLAAALVALAPWYGIFAFVGYPLAYECLPGRWAWAGAATTSMVMAVTYMGGLDRIDTGEWWLWGAITLVSTVLAVMFLYFADATERHSRRQKQALAQLHEANVRLEAALAENAELHARLLVGAREAGASDERQRMAREIHDTLAQGLAGIVAQLEAAEQVLTGPPEARRHVVAARGLARESLVEARRTVRAVGPDALAGAGLADAIDGVARRWSEAHGTTATLTTTGHARPMHAEVEVTLLRAAQEALANVAKHAGAGRVGLTLSYMEDLVTLDVRDDGVGFDPGAERPRAGADGGFGLAGMRQRVQRLAGTLVIESEPGGGTAVSASVPAIPAGGAA
jgi:signal transduction histidine kinase